MLKWYGVRLKHGLGYHPQTSGQVEISNWEIKIIFKKIGCKVTEELGRQAR